MGFQDSNYSIYEKIPCFITGRLVYDTDRERIKQKLARFMVEELGYYLDDFVVDRDILIQVGGVKVKAIVDLSVVVDGKTLMILRGGPGSVVTRESGTVAAARLLETDYIVPWAVQANLFDASILDVKKKKAVAYGWDNIPTRKELISMTSQWPPPKLPEQRVPVERQILYSYDTHG
ncbi:hypothetical protein DBT_1023 [Dissulfuribacter thermophilus]|uniref:Type I restriction enzyme R protein N-terminal domain-containing protein n=1 Tax=Dissulfuribacter thermophilus TaxID=1156395 RepID=A0A1B9F6Y0_9BACT|nr:type I restriction enzyme HsdR N-terminal domain-containing protein [Dissulfuribacter thermophilus]OCC15672.1 hypothetical protein DBT_1023 [Dissulfuribacter thermophilus]